MQRHHQGLGLLYLLGGMGLGWWAYTITPDVLSTLRFGTVGVVQFPTRHALLACGVALITGAWGMLAAPASRLHAVGLGVNVLGLVCSILVWASMGQRLEVLGLLAQSLRLATPIALGALAGLLCERCGVVNIGIEGMMLTAACLGFIIALYTSNTWIGLAMAILVGVSWPPCMPSWRYTAASIRLLAVPCSTSLRWASPAFCAALCPAEPAWGSRRFANLARTIRERYPGARTDFLPPSAAGVYDLAPRGHRPCPVVLHHLGLTHAGRGRISTCG